MGFDLLEDVFAFLYATGGSDRMTGHQPHCHECGAELEEGDEGSDICAECNETIDAEESDDC